MDFAPAVYTRTPPKYLVFGAGGIAVLSYLSIIETLHAIDEQYLQEVEGCVGCSAGAFATLAVALNMQQRTGALRDVAHFMMDKVYSTQTKDFRFNGTSAFDIEHGSMGENIRESVGFMLELCGLHPQVSLEKVQMFCRIRMIFVLTDLISTKPVYIDASHDIASSMSVAEIIEMSSAIPFLHTPLQLGQTLIVDGALSDSLPLNVFPVEETLVIRTKSAMKPTHAPAIKLGSQHVDVMSYVMLLKTCFTHQMEVHLDRITSVYETICVTNEVDALALIQKNEDMSKIHNIFRERGVFSAATFMYPFLPWSFSVCVAYLCTVCLRSG
eukprot:6212381-Pleurochrysis_carterae.AAC.2